MNQDDLRLKKQVEAVLVRNYVNTQYTDVDVVGGNVYLDGAFYLGGAHATHDDESDKDMIESHQTVRRALLSIESQIRSCGELSGLYFNFSNWSKSGTGWVPKKELTYRSLPSPRTRAAHAV